MGFWLWIGSIALAAYLGWRLRRYQQDIDDYEQREYRDPPIFDAGSFLGGDRF
jgi:hypothetical protein